MELFGVDAIMHNSGNVNVAFKRAKNVFGSSNVLKFNNTKTVKSLRLRTFVEQRIK